MQNELWFGKYRIQKELKRNEDTIVYLAEHISLHSLCILKQMRKKSPLCSSLYHEAEILSGLNHSSIPCIYDFMENEELICLALQYLPGQTLSFVCHNTELSEKLILSYAISICDILQYLHSRSKPVLHLDIKPSNLLISESEVYLIDFGSAIRKAEKRKEIFGTRWFAPPEQYQQKSLDERADIYALGMVLYYMVFGQEYANKRGENIDTKKSCSKELKAVINRCLKRKPSSRFCSVLEIKRQLLHIKKNEKTTKQRISGMQKKTTIYCIAGSQSHIGVTHFALYLCKYIKENCGNCLYIEQNPSCAVRQMIAYRGKQNQSGIYTYEGIPMLPFLEERGEKDYERMEYPYVVMDFGVLSEQKKEYFLQGDFCFVVIGAKDWEMKKTLHLIHALVGEKVVYLGNYVGTKEIERLVQMEQIKIERLPYDPIFQSKNKGGTQELIKELISHQV